MKNGRLIVSRFVIFRNMETESNTTLAKNVLLADNVDKRHSILISELPDLPGLVA